MGICLSCGTETATPPICNACFNTTHRKGCRCQVCFDTLQSSIATLEAELTAEREAVRVLKDECSLANKVIVGNAECHTLILNCHITAYREWTAAQSRTDANRIASAAITDAAKAREGA